jgi:hypothetical protein
MSLVDSWDRFLASLQSEGGKMMIIVGMITLILGATMYMNLHNHPIQEVGRELMTGFLGSLFTLLLQYLRTKA